MPPSSGRKITLAGVERTLRYTTRSFVAMEREHGFTLGKLNAALTDRSIAGASVMVWAGLQHEEKPPTLDEVYDLIDLADLGVTFNTVGAAILEALGRSEEKNEGKAEAPPS